MVFVIHGIRDVDYWTGYRDNPGSAENQKIVSIIVSLYISNISAILSKPLFFLE